MTEARVIPSPVGELTNLVVHISPGLTTRFVSSWKFVGTTLVPHPEISSGRLFEEAANIGRQGGQRRVIRRRGIDQKADAALQVDLRWRHP